MTASRDSIHERCILTGSLFNEPTRVETARTSNDGILTVGLVGTQPEWFRRVTEKFLILKGGDIRDQFGVNQWPEQKKVITSQDLAKRTEILPGMRQVQRDLIIVDESHRMSWTPPACKTARYALGELLRDTSDNILLLTATPHKGDPANFSLFLPSLDSDACADVRSIHEAMERRRAPFYLRRTKEAMIYFPERRPDLPAGRQVMVGGDRATGGREKP
jgi:SNF2 family DNA or RNA helicase